MPAPLDQQGARDMYLNTNASQREIAEAIGIDPKTLYQWIKSGRWAEMKAAARQAPGIIQQQLYNHISAINDNISKREDCLPTFKEVDMLRKLILSTKQMQQLSLGTYIQVFQEFTSFMHADTPDLELTKKITLIADRYLQGMTNRKTFLSNEAVKDISDSLKEMEKNVMVSPVEPSPSVIVSPAEPSPSVIVCPVELPAEPSTDVMVSPAEPSPSVIVSLVELPAEPSADERVTSGNENEPPADIMNSISTTSHDISTIPLPDFGASGHREMHQETEEEIIAKLETNITKEDYNFYYHILDMKTEDIHATVLYKGYHVNLMTMYYNFKQFEEPEHRRKFLTRQQVVTAYLLRNKK